MASKSANNNSPSSSSASSNNTESTMAGHILKLAEIFENLNIQRRTEADSKEKFASERKTIEIMCALCSKINFKGYRYQCLTCPDSYKLCSYCFEHWSKPNGTNDDHSPGHPMVRYHDEDGSDGYFFGHHFRPDQMNLNSFAETFKNEIHYNVVCDVCQQEPLKGVRLKCDVCLDYDLCFQCFRAGRKSKSHSVRSHPLIAIGRAESLEVANSDFEKFGKPLGGGAFGTVFKANYLKTNQVVACKVIRHDVLHAWFRDVEPMMLVKSFLRELAAFQEVKGENIHRMIGHSSLRSIDPRADQFELIILTEFMEKGSLQSLLTNEPDLPYRRRLQIATGVAAGMARMHEMNFIHRDIRPDNILIDAEYNAKIADMGIAKIYQDKQFHTMGVGCRQFMPPEFYSGHYTKKLDIYTYGLTLNQLFDGVHQFLSRVNRIVIDKPARVFYYFVQKCTQSSPSARPDAKDLERDLNLFESTINSVILKGIETYKKKSSEQKNNIFKVLYDQTLELYRKKQL